MAKVLLVEDDNNLREIFEMRLQAEGYDTVIAGDGEEALAVATKEKPALIIADVMMPKLSGFEMLETLRASPEMKDIKVIMMTALGQAEDQARGQKLGVVKYLVKSQVTLEDFVRSVREVMPPDAPADGAATAAPDAKQGLETEVNNKQESEQSMQDNTNPTMPPADGAGAASNPMGGDAPATPSGDPMTTSQEQNVVDSQVNNFAASAPSDAPAVPADPATAPAGDGGAPAGDSPAFPPAEPPVAPTETPPAEGAGTPPAAV